MLERLEFTLSKGPYPLPVAVSIKHGLHFHLWYDPGEQVALCPTHMLLDRARPIHVESMKLLGWPVSVRCPWQCRPCGKHWSLRVGHTECFSVHRFEFLQPWHQYNAYYEFKKQFFLQKEGSSSTQVFTEGGEGMKQPLMTSAEMTSCLFSSLHYV